MDRSGRDRDQHRHLWRIGSDERSCRRVWLYRRLHHGPLAVMNDLLLKALRCESVPRPPVWLMPQAGPYMPQYRALRSKHSLWEMFHEPELAAEVTRLPLEH